MRQAAITRTIPTELSIAVFTVPLLAEPAHTVPVHFVAGRPPRRLAMGIVLVNSAGCIVGREPEGPLRAMTGGLTPPEGSEMTAHAEPDTDADDATVIRLSRREPERFNVLFRRHAPHIQRYVVRRLG